MNRSRRNERTRLGFIERLEARALLASDVYISEFVASNDDGLRDEDGDSSDWVEIYNAGPDDINLTGWHLTDDADELAKWSFPAVELPAKRFLVVHASDKDRRLPNQPLHANFKLASGGEYLALSDNNNQIVSDFAPEFPQQFTDISYGVTQSSSDNGVTRGTYGYFEEPTPRSLNASNSDEVFAPISLDFSHPHGFYEESFSLAITASETINTIRYTLDGSEPTSSNGTIYRSPIRIRETSTVRAIALKNGRDPSPVQTATYLFLDDVLQQSASGRPPSGFPTSQLINGQVLDYGMDPAIVNDPTWGPQLKDALTAIPSLSLVMDIDDLLDRRTGIYTNASLRGRDWERPASLELIDPAGDTEQEFQVEAGVRIRGGFSRSDNNPKHAFRFFFREEYGDAKLEFPLFGDEGTDEFDKIDLRTTQNYSWAFRGSNDNAFVRDVFSRDMQRELGQPYTRSRFYHLYLNGQYWGLYQTQERAEARYAASYFGGDKEDYDVVKSAGNDGGYENEATDGTLDAYRRLADYFYQSGGLSDRNMDDYYRAQGMNPDGTRNDEFERLLNVDNLIDYLLITYFTGDRDGPVSRFVNGVNNYFGIYNRENPDGFLFFEHDSEHSLDQGFPNLAEQITSNGRQFKYFNPLWMHEQLVDGNTEYQLRFADRVLKYFESDGPFSETATRELIDNRAAEIDLAIIAESARWGDAKSSQPLTKTDWLNAIDQVRGFLPGRGEVLLEQFRNLGWMSDIGRPQFFVEDELQTGGPISIRNEISLQPEPVTTFNQTLIEEGASWRYLDDGSDQGSSWRELNFTESNWRTGRAEIGYGDGDETTRISFGSNSNNKHITTYFRKNFTVQDPDRIDALMLRLLRDDGAVVYLNGEEIVRSNMPGGEISSGTTASGTVGGTSESTYFQHQLDSSLLRAGSNVLAVEIHQVSASSSDVSFDLELLGGTTQASTAIVYYTLDGTDPRLPGGDIHPDAIRYRSPFSIANSSHLRARSRLRTDWSPESNALFEVIDPALQTIDDKIVIEEGGTTSELEGGAGSVLDNDIGLQNQPVRVTVQRRPQHSSSFELNPDGTFQYVHDGSETIADSFTYRVTDANGKSDVATVEIVILQVSDSTPIAIQDEIAVFEGGSAFLLVTRKRSVVDNDEGLDDTPITITLERAPNHSDRFDFNGDGTFNYRHDGSENHADSFAYRIEDNDGQVGIGEVSILVTPVSDSTPNAIDDLISIEEGATATLLSTGETSVLANDLRLIDEPFVATIIQPPSAASSFEFFPDGTFLYQHNGSDIRTDSFVYRVTDSDGGFNNATVDIVIQALDESVPNAIDDLITVAERGTVAVLDSGETNVLANDQSLQDGPYTVRLVAEPKHASQFRLDRTGTFRYVHNGAEEFVDSFTYEIRDVDGDTDIGEVRISITPRSDATPRARNDTIAVMQGETVSVLTDGASSLLANDRSLADTPIVVRVTSPPKHAAEFTVNEDGTFVYTHDGSDTSADSFDYELRDSDGQTSTATVDIQIDETFDVGDLNQDGRIDDLDIDWLSLAIATNDFQPSLDLNSDGRLDDDDIVFLVEEILRTKRGDVDLNGIVEFADFLIIADAFGQKNAGWKDGNFNEDQAVDFADFLLFADNFGIARVSVA